MGCSPDCSRSADDRRNAQTTRISNRLYRQMASRLGLEHRARSEKTFYGGEKGDDRVPTAEHLNAWQHTFSQRIPGGPIARGFDEYFGTDVPNWPPFCYIEQDKTVGIPSQFLPNRLFRKNQASQQGPALEGWQLEPILPALGERASALVDRMASKQQTFFRSRSRVYGANLKRSALESRACTPHSADRDWVIFDFSIRLF